MRRIGWKQRSDRVGRLRRISAWELLQAQQEALCMCRSREGFGLCLNACMLARALMRHGTAAFASGEAVLHALTEPQIFALTERYLTRYAGEPALPEKPEAVNPHFDAARFEELRNR